MERHKAVPSVCIVGRPNVGKSSLFNCLVGHRKAVVVGESGTTRDRVEAVISIQDYAFKIVDTGGFVAADSDGLSHKIKEQIYEAVGESSIIMMVADIRDGVTPADREVADIIRKCSKPVVIVANKADNAALEDDAVEFYQLGLGGDPVPVSCLHRKGISGLKDRIFEAAGDLLEGRVKDEAHLRIAVVGRPNVGKSSFVNCLLQRERVIVSEIPGTTRDSIDTFFTFEGGGYILIDTAGMRHRRKIKTVVDTFSVMRSEETIKRADIVILLLDARDGVTRDDISILDMIEDSGKGCVVLVNKWDLARETAQAGQAGENEYLRHLVYASSRLRNYPVIFVSAKSGERVAESLSAVKLVNANLDLKVSTPLLNSFFERKDPSRVPVSRRKKRPNFLYFTQTGVRPVVFTAFVNYPEAVLTAHRSFIENILRENLPLSGIPVRIEIRKSKRKYK